MHTRPSDTIPQVYLWEALIAQSEMSKCCSRAYRGTVDLPIIQSIVSSPDSSPLGVPVPSIGKRVTVPPDDVSSTVSTTTATCSLWRTLPILID